MALVTLPLWSFKSDLLYKSYQIQYFLVIGNITSVQTVSYFVTLAGLELPL